MRIKNALLLALCLGVLEGTAPAATLFLNPSPPAAVYQQTTANPCVFGGNNCQNPSGFPSVDTPTGGSTTTFTGTQSYTLANYPAIFTTGFVVGVDANDTNVAQHIDSFTITFDGPNGVTHTYGGGDFPNIHNGVGYTDYLLTLAGGATIPIPTGATTVTFSTSLSGLNDGADRFFIVPAGTTSVTPPPNDNPVPEPSSILLVSSAAIALVALRKYKY